jgi:cytochrome c peroxidase
MRLTLVLALVVLLFAFAGGRSRADKLPPVPKPGPSAEPQKPEQVGLPVELTRAVTPAPPATPELIALGKKLFFDARLSADGTVACATCHNPDKGFTDQRATSVGINGQVGHRNAPTILNALYNEVQFWDGRARRLEDQAKLPILNPIEMGQKSPADVIAALAKTELAGEAQKLFGRPLDYDDVARALAAYERTQLAFDAPFDKFLAGDDKAIDAAAKRGWMLFNGKGRCMSCHPFNLTQPLGTDEKFHNIGVSAHKSDFVALARKALELVSSESAEGVDRAAITTDMSELGRFLVTKQPFDIGGFKTPQLRNLLVTAPYFHDGSQDTLWDVVDHYNKGGVQNPFLDGGMQRLGLTESEIDDLVAFLATLTSSRYAEPARRELAKQRALSRSKRPQRDAAAATGKKAQAGLTGPWGDVAPNPGPGDKNPAQIGGR